MVKCSYHKVFRNNCNAKYILSVFQCICCVLDFDNFSTALAFYLKSLLSKLTINIKRAQVLGRWENFRTDTVLEQKEMLLNQTAILPFRFRVKTKKKKSFHSIWLAHCKNVSDM